MSRIFYYGSDGKIYGPHTELTVQGWYASGFFSSDVKFQISSSDQFDSNGRLFTLGELIEKNGRILPFYLSPEKEIRENEQEKALQKLKQDVESIITNKDKYVEKDIIGNLQNQIASLAESNATLLKKVQELSSKKENSPIAPDLEKKLNELKKEVEKQEKNSGSMKKIMSDNTSKCDRNDSKMEQTVKRQNDMEEKMAVHSSQIAELQANGKDIDSNLTAFRENIRESADQCRQMMNSLKEVKEGFDKHTEECSTSRSELDKIQTQITEVIATMDDHKERFNDVERKSEELRERLQSLNDDSMKQALNVQQATSMLESTSATAPPWEQVANKANTDGIEPWNRPAGSSEVKLVENAKSESKGEVTKSGNAATGVAPKPKAKDWDAICREISDDEEEEWMSVEEEEKEEAKSVVKEERKPVKAPEQVAAPSPAPAAAAAAAAPANNSLLQSIIDARPNVPRANRELIERFIKMFRLYLRMLRTKELDQLIKLGPKALEGFNFTLLEWHSESQEFIPLAQAMLAEIPKVCDEMELICWACPCRMFTPINVFDHLVDDYHFEKMKELGNIAFLYGMAVQRVIGKLSWLLKRTSPFKRENVMNSMAIAMYIPLMGNECLRPTRDFVRSKLQEYLNIICKGDERATMLANVGGELSYANDEYYMRVVRKWFKEEKNREKFLKDLDEHLSTGISHCSVCKMAFESKEDFYKHVTSYVHARIDQRVFAGNFFRLARGTLDWDITM